MPKRLYRILYETVPRLVLERAGKWLLLESHLTIGELMSHESLVHWSENVQGESLSATNSLQLLAPIEDQDVWACGVTYYSSRRARVAESGEQASIYDRVYSAERPQIFPKARGRHVITTGQVIRLRTDSSWIVPEPELVLVINRHGRIVGVTVGNDVTCRDIEGENPLYQPQAKIWEGSCGLAPSFELTESIDVLQKKEIHLTISREGRNIFEETCSVSQVVRKLELLVQILFKWRSFSEGAYLFTGTGIVPPDSFSLQQGDTVCIAADSLPALVNTVAKF